MKKAIKILILFIILLILFFLVYYKESRQEEKVDPNKIIEISVIDKYDKIKEIHKNPEEEKYVLVDVIIDGIKYKDCGIRTKGSFIYESLKKYKIENYSYKVKLDYRNKKQKYKGMNELYINSSVYDATGIKEYLAYDIYNKMGIETQNYSLGHLKLGNVDRGLVTIIEVINENYIQKKYNSEDGNLYKPEADTILMKYDGADLKYVGEDYTSYEGIFRKTKTDRTTLDDKKRLINIVKNINNSSSAKIIEENFMDFDKIIKMIAINKVLGNIDTMTTQTTRNYYIYEKDGKIDILVFDFDLSLNSYVNASYWKQNINEFDLSKDDEKIYSRITEIILQNEEYLNKYYQYIEQTLLVFQNIENDNTVQNLYEKTKDLVKANEKSIFSYGNYKAEIKKLENFIYNRKNDYKNFKENKKFDY